MGHNFGFLELLSRKWKEVTPDNLLTIWNNQCDTLTKCIATIFSTVLVIGMFCITAAAVVTLNWSWAQYYNFCRVSVHTILRLFLHMQTFAIFLFFFLGRRLFLILLRSFLNVVSQRIALFRQRSVVSCVFNSVQENHLKFSPHSNLFLSPWSTMNLLPPQLEQV